MGQAQTPLLQVAPHDVSPGRQTHAPAAHAWVPVHVLPQSPQLRASLVTSVQRPAHIFALEGHAHAPATHASPPQSLPQPPQLRASLLKSTQRPPHVLPVAHVHLPDAQVPAVPHDPPHEPQFAASFERSLQLPLQFTSPVGHVAEQVLAPQT